MSKTFASASAYPLEWPVNFPVTGRRAGSQFKTSLFNALENVNAAVRKFGADSGKKLDNIIISSNYSLTDTRPDNPGVAVYFDWDGETVCIPVDRYNKVECNLQAIYHCIEAKRTMLRHGGINLVKAAFRGYTALPPAADSGDWRTVLGFGQDITPTYAEAKKRYRTLISKAHSDRGGSHEESARINAAWALAEKELK